MSLRIAATVFALCLSAWARVAAAGEAGIEITLDETSLQIEFSKPMRVLENVESRDLVSSIPARRYACTWQDDIELYCTIEGEPLPPATSVAIVLADGLQTATGKRLGARRFETETDRPSLRASIESWDGTRPRVVLESTSVLDPQQAAGVLRLRSGGREWSKLSLRPLSLEHREWMKSRFALDLPEDIAAGAEVELHILPGLRTSAGPLPGDQKGRLLRFVDREPFQLRAVYCGGPLRTVQRTVRDALLSTQCVPGEPVWLAFSSPLDDAGRRALVAALPKSFAVETWSDQRWWPGMQSDRDLQRRTPAGAGLRIDAPMTDETFDLGPAIQDAQGRALTPVRLRIATSEARPQLQASASALLLGDPALDPIRSINAAPEALRVTAVDGGFATADVDSPDSRGRVAGVNAEASVRALAAGGWAQWRHGRQTLHVAAPQFEISAYVSRRELAAWVTEWHEGDAIADADVELLLLVEGAPPRRIVGGRSDRDGLLRLHLPDDLNMPEEKRGVSPPQWLLRARAGTRLAVLPLAVGQGYGVNLGAQDADVRLWGVADRPLYRAGDTVRYRLWLRERSGGRLKRLSGAAPVELALYYVDENRPLRAWTATPDELGAIAGEERLPEHLVDGNYCIRSKEEFQPNEGTCFFVGTYRSQDLWAEASTEDTVLHDGDTFVANIAAGYYSGGSAAGVALDHVSTMLVGLPLSTAYPAYAEYGFVDVSRGVGGEGVALQGESRDWGKLDPAGKARVALPLKFSLPEEKSEADLPAFGRLKLTAEVKLEARESTVTNLAEARYARYARYVGLRIAPRWFDATTPLRLDGVVIDAEGHAQPGAAIDVTVDYLPGFDDGADKPTERESVGRCVLVAGTTSTCDFPRKRSGRYVLTARSGDAAPVEIERYVWAGGRTGTAAKQVELEVIEAPATPDAPARLLLKSPYDRARAWVVVHSEGMLLDSRVVDIDGPVRELLLPLHAEGRGHLEVQALVRERTDAGVDANGLRLPAKRDTNSVEITIPRREAAPQLVLTLDKDRAEPAQVVHIRLHNDGNVPRTVTLAVLDDAVRALGSVWWSDFDPRSERWLEMQPEDWRSRLFLAGFGAWNATPWQQRLPWRDARQPVDDASAPANGTGVAAGASAGEPPPVIFEEVSSPGYASRPAEAPPAPERANARAADGDALDTVVVTGSRIQRVDSFALVEASSPVLSIDRAKIEAKGMRSVGDPLPDLAGTRPGAGRAHSDKGRTPHDRDAQRADDARSLFGARLRGRFADTALWEPEIRLAPGETRIVEFTVPDNLTRWRAVAWSSDADEGFEMAEVTIEVGLPLEVRLQTPVRVYPGDRADLIANVRQTGDRAADTDLLLQVEALGAESQRAVVLAPLGQTALPLRIAPGDDDLQGPSRRLAAVAATRSGAHSDAVSASIELASPVIEARKVQAGWLGSESLRLDAPTLPRSASDVELRVSLLPGADALVHRWIDDLYAYPHRCWEQILSRGVAAAIALDRGDGERWPDAKSAIREVTENARVFQNESGAFRYFADAEDPGRYGDAKAQHALTAYSVRALRLLRDMGHAVPDEALRRGEDFLARPRDPPGNDRVQAEQTAFVVAAQADPDRKVLDALWRQWSGLGLAARVATTRAMLAGGHPDADRAIAWLRAASKTRGEARVLYSDLRDDRWMSSDLREQCEFIGLLFDFPKSGDAALRRSLIAGLGNLYAGGTESVDTQTGASCLIALRALDKPRPGDAVSLDIVHGDDRGTLRLGAGQPAPSWRRALTPVTVKTPLQLTPHVEGNAPASYIAEVTYREDAREAGSTAVGFSLSRRYEVFRERGWVAVEGQTLKDGDWLRITLVLNTAAERYFVAMTDGVPGGLRPTDLALGGVAGLDLQALSDKGSYWFGTRRLDPRAPKFYAEYLPAGRHEVHYFARVGNSGDYLAAPAVAELMYGASTRARTAAARIAIVPAAVPAAVPPPEKPAD